MPSQFSRAQLVTQALNLAGRSQELAASCNMWLNLSLRDLGLTYRFPELRKVGTPQQLALGTNLAALPADLGAGMEMNGMIFGPDNRPMAEVPFQEFAINSGFFISGTTGKPRRYLVDKESGNFRFDLAADQAYAFTPVYFKNPPLLDVASSDDSKTIWLDNDMLAVHLLMWWIYIFTNDDREQVQDQRVKALITKWERDTAKIGGTARILPSPARFKSPQYMGYGGFVP